MTDANKKFLKGFDGYVILSHFERFNKHLKTKPEPVHCWTVTIALTSGDVEFYITAKDEEMAMKKAREYAFDAELGLIREYKLLP